MMRIIFYITLLPVILFGQMASYEMNGYAKYLFSTARFSTLDRRLNDHLLHTRINTRWYPVSDFTAGLELRFRGFYGGSIKHIPDYKNQVKDDYDLMDLDAMLWDTDESLGYAEIDRIYLDYVKNQFQFTAGRQRVAWGTSLVWNIVDIFNPMDILDFDYEEKPGTDAVRVQYYTGAVSRIEAVYQPGRNKYRQVFAGLWSVNAWAYDFFLIAARQNNRNILAGAWSGDVKGAGFRGEWKLSDPPDKGRGTNNPIPIPGETDLTEYDKTVFSFVLSGDYTFTNTFYIHTEAMYNSNGKLKNAGLFWRQTTEAGMLSPARWSLYQEFAFDVTPLIRGSVFGLINPNDQSFLIAPSVSWSVTGNLDFLGMVYFTKGDLNTEFGDFDTTIFTRLKYSF